MNVEIITHKEQRLFEIHTDTGSISLRIPEAEYVSRELPFKIKELIEIIENERGT